jgi:hypothetical protein
MAAGLYVIPAGADAWASYIDQSITALNDGWVLDQSGTDATGAFTTRATFATATTFTLVGDQTTTYVPGRRLRIVHAGGTTYTEVGTSAFGASTTVTIGAVSSGPTTMTTPITSVAFALAYPSMTTGNYTHALPWQVLTRKSTTVVASTASLTADSTMFTYTIPAALLGSSGVLRLSCFGDYLNNSGAQINSAWKFIIGTSTVIAMTTGTSAIVNSANRRWWQSVITIQNAGSASAQRVSGIFNITASATQSFELVNIASTALANNSYMAQGYGTAAEASTAALILSYILRLASTATTVDANLFHAVLEFCP